MALHGQTDGYVLLLGYRQPPPLVQCSDRPSSASSLGVRLPEVECPAKSLCILVVHPVSSSVRKTDARRLSSRSLAVRLEPGRPSWLSAVYHEHRSLSPSDVSDARRKVVVGS